MVIVIMIMIIILVIVTVITVKITLIAEIPLVPFGTDANITVVIKVDFTSGIV